MQIPEQPVYMQAEISEYEGGCGMTLWTVFLVFWCCLIYAEWASGYSLSDALRMSAVPCLGVCGGIGLIHLAEYLLRKRIRILVTDSFITLLSVRRFSKEKVLHIPVSEVRDIQVYYKKMVICTGQKNHSILHFANAENFADQLRPFLRAHGADIPKTCQENYAERLALTEKWKRRQAERLLMQQAAQRPVTTDENGQPILPQCLTDEQADGVFRPSAVTEVTDMQNAADDPMQQPGRVQNGEQ